jgi:hypothetical protein
MSTSGRRRPVCSTMKREQLPEGPDPRPAQLVGLPGRRPARQRRHDRIRHVADIDRLEARAPLITGMKGSRRAIPAKRPKKLSPGPKTMEGRRIVACGKAARSPASPSRLAAGVAALARRIGADGRDVHQPLDAGRCASRAMRAGPSACTASKSPCRMPTVFTTTCAPSTARATPASSVAQVAELVDALASGASGRKAVKVRVLSWAPQ